MLDPETRNRILIASGIGLVAIIVSFVLMMQQGSNLLSWTLLLVGLGCTIYSRRIRKPPQR